MMGHRIIEWKTGKPVWSWQVATPREIARYEAIQLAMDSDMVLSTLPRLTQEEILRNRERRASLQTYHARERGR